MKELLLKSTKKVAILAALFGVISLNSCKDEDPVEPVVQAEDGFYVSGAATAYSGLDLKAAFKSTKNEVGQADRAQLMQAFVALKGGQPFNITQVAGTTQTVWGPAANFAEVAAGAGTTDEPKEAFQRGGIEVTANTFTVPADGLYQIAFDTEVGKAVIVPVSYWALIGAATPGGWSSDTKLESKGFDANVMTFEATEVTITKADYKFRFSGGWKVEIDPDFDLGGGSTGIKVNTNLGGSVDALAFGGDNINNAVSGIYTATITWTAGSGFTATMTKTGDLPLTDYSAVELGLIGDGLYNGAAQHDWNSGLMLSTPAKSGNVYTWAYNGTKVTTAGSFKIRQGADWNGYSFGYPQVTMAGDGAGDFSGNGDGNFVPAVNDAMYDFTFAIDAENDTYTFTATKK